MATLKTRLAALLRGKDDDHFEILNPRYWERDDADRHLTEAQWDAMADERIRQAELAGHKIIRIQPPRGYGD